MLAFELSYEGGMAVGEYDILYLCDDLTLRDGESYVAMKRESLEDLLRNDL